MDTVDPRTHYMATFTGEHFFPAAPNVDQIHIADIAISLSRQCRYNGHCREFYSVAQHSVIVSHFLPAPLRFWGLMHDAAEAYVGDMVYPAKRLLGTAFSDIEQPIMDCVVKRFGLSPAVEPPVVKEADIRALAWEKRDLLGDGEFAKKNGISIPPFPLIALSPPDAVRLFLYTFGELS